MDNKVKISIIVPVYNAEKYLSNCIESILNQTFSEFELLLVDDGSHDSSGKICDKYAAIDSRIRVFHKENGGVSSARNLGLDNARGRWIYFLDSDDWLDLDTFTCLYRETTDNELIRHFFQDVTSIDPLVTHKRQYIIPDTKEEFFNQVISRRTFLGVCGALFASNLFENLRFDTTITMGEDWLVLTQILIKCKRVKVIPKTYYFYNKTNEKSSTFVFSERKYIDNCRALSEIYSTISCDHKKERIMATSDIQFNFFYMLLKDDKHDSFNSFNHITNTTGNKLRIIDMLKSSIPIKKIFIVQSLQSKYLFDIIKKIYRLKYNLKTQSHDPHK